MNYDTSARNTDARSSFEHLDSNEFSKILILPHKSHISHKYKCMNDGFFCNQLADPKNWSAQSSILCRKWLGKKSTFRHSAIAIFSPWQHPTQRTIGEPPAPSVDTYPLSVILQKRQEVDSMIPTMVGAETSCWPMKDQQRLARLTTRPPCDCWECARIRLFGVALATVKLKHYSLVRSRRPTIPNITCPKGCLLLIEWTTSKGMTHWSTETYLYKPCRCFDSQADSMRATGQVSHGKQGPILGGWVLQKSVKIRIHPLGH